MEDAAHGAVARQLAEDARPILGAEGFSDERIDELAYAFVNDRVGDDSAQFVNWGAHPGTLRPGPRGGTLRRPIPPVRDVTA
jgi:hypothetical protein